jgi:hypothetical protein
VTLRRVIRSVVPAGVSKNARRWVATRRVGRAVRLIQRRAVLGPSELRSLRTAWGNEEFSADLRYLTEMMRLIRETPSDVLECGTGATTLIAGALAEHFGFRVYSLEQEAEWASAVKEVLSRHGLHRVTVLEAPIRRYGEHAWYDTSNLRLPQQFGIVICDGPFVSVDLGEPAYSNWRYGVLEHLARTHSSFEALLLDDVEEPRAPAMLHAWTERFGTSVKILHDVDGDCAIVSLPRTARKGPTQ